MQYTKKEYDILLYLRRRPRTANEIRDKFKPLNDWTWNTWMSDLSPLYYVEPENAKILAHEGTLHLNEQGETVAQAEFDRRFDMYFTRIVALLALLVSLFAVSIDVIQSTQELPQPQCQCTTTYCECDLRPGLALHN